MTNLVTTCRKLFALTIFVTLLTCVVPAMARTIIIGDSITARIPYGALPGVVNMGKDGDIISGVEARLRFDPPGPGDDLVIAIAVNDLFDRHIDDVLSDYSHLLRSLPTAHRLVIVAPLPINDIVRHASPWVNERIAAFSHGLHLLAVIHGAEFVEASPDMLRDGRLREEMTIDGVHLNDAGYAVRVAQLRKTITAEN